MYPQITSGQLRTLLRSKKRFALVDAHSEREYACEHIPGAVSLPAETLEKKAGELFGKDDLLIVYGAGPRDGAAETAAARLASLDSSTS
jgi:rhodanese-related sulfurtransferase